MLWSGNARIRRNNEKNDLIYLKDNNSDEFFKKYRAYLESETTKTYINDKLEFFQEIRGLTEIVILCELLTTNTLRVLESRAS